MTATEEHSKIADSKIAERSKSAIEPRAWRVEFAENLTAIPAGVEAVHVTEPRNVTAILTPVAVSKVLSDTSAKSVGALTMIWMPPEVNTPETIERDVDQWMLGAGVAKKQVTTRAEVRSLRVVWGETRVAVYANEGDLRHALDAVLRFSVVEREALALEETMRSTWVTIGADAALTHAITIRELKMQPHINYMTEVTTRMKIAWLRISRCIEQLNPTIAEPSKRIFAELVSAASLHDRVETLENPIQFGLDHYEISNTRLIDMYLARTDRLNSIFGYGAIIVLLIIQTWIMLIEAGLL